MSGLVIAAIGFQLLLCSASSAAMACSGSLDRSARRIPSSVAHAFREIVDRNIIQDQCSRFIEPGFTLLDCPTARPSSPATDSLALRVPLSAPWLINLPPPSIA